MNLLRIFAPILISASVIAPLPAEAAFWNKKKKTTLKTDTLSSYDKIVSSKNNESKGMFNVYQKDEDYYFDIPASLLGRDMLVVNKLNKVPLELNEAGVNRGVNYQNQMISFELDKSRKNIVVRQRRVLPQSPKDDAITRSVADNYISPLIESFKVESFNSDSTRAVIKITQVFNGKETSFNDVFNSINLGTSAKKDLSTIKSIKSFPNNITAISELTTKVTEGNSSVNVTVEVGTTIALLPEKPMVGRYDSPRIGYFTSDVLYYSDDQQKVDNKKYITRWRLEPTDKAAYLSGELVEPVKPIVFYIDNSTPRKWREYLKKGVDDWNVAFNKIGFKNAIVAKDLADSIDVDGDDINYSVLTYVASTKQNAMGPSTIDPRSGEIIEADIIWWHNVLSMLQQWITVQTGTVNPDAQSIVIPDSIMGDAIRFVICHEVGHSLGLRHNMMGSWAIKTESLRSKEFTDMFNSTSSSIMDYARFNYVAQPEDGVTKLSPNIGPYDLLAIEYGYRWLGDINSDAEKSSLHSLLENHKDRLYKYSEAQSTREAVDPRAQNEDLGDDPVLSSKYGIANLKRIMPNVIDWSKTGEVGQTYDETSRLYFAVVNQWNNYLYHVMTNIGGIYLENTTIGDGQDTYTFVEREKQAESLDFLINEVLTFPRWLFDTEISKYTYLRRATPFGIVEYAPTSILKNAQAYVFWDLLSNDRLVRMLENELVNGKKAFTAVEFMDRLHRHIFAVTERSGTPDVMTRNIQKSFVDALITAAASSEGIKVNKKLVEPRLVDDCHSFCSHDDHDRMGARRELSFYSSQSNRNSDAISVKRGELLRIKDLLKRSLGTSDIATQYHYKDILLRINDALNIK